MPKAINRTYSFAINPWIGLDRDDLVQIGSMAMVDAAKSYDPNHGAKLETFMTPVLKNAMIDLIHRNGRNACVTHRCGGGENERRNLD